MLRAGADPNLDVTEGFTPLMLACTLGDTNIVRALLDAPGINPNARNQAGETTFHVAVRYGALPAVLLLLSHNNINITAVTGNGCTALHLAAARDDLVMLAMLLTDGRFAINQQSADGLTPLMTAVQQERLANICLLLNRPEIEVNTQDRRGFSALHYAVLGSNPHILAELLAVSGILINATDHTGSTPLHLAAGSGRIEQARALLAMPAIAVNQTLPNGMTPLHIAARQGDVTMVRALINADGIALNAAVPGLSFTPLHVAALWGYAEVVRLLVNQEGVDLHARAHHNETVLHLAATGGHAEVLEAVIATGRADINAGAQQNNTALHFAAANGSVQAVKVLMDAPGIHLNAINMNGNTALCLAMHNKKMHAVLALLDNPKVDPNGALPLLFFDQPPLNFLMFRAGMELRPIPDSTQLNQVRVDIMKRWAAFSPEDGAPNRLLTSKTHFTIGTLLIQMPRPSDDPCYQDAPFHFALALEQAEQAHGGYSPFVQQCAQWLLASSDAGTFNIGGIALPRREIEDMAQATGNYLLEGDLQRVVHDHWQANVHQGGFLMRGRDILERLVQHDRTQGSDASASTVVNAMLASIDQAIPANAATPRMKQMLQAFEPDNAQVLQRIRHETKQAMTAAIAGAPQAEQAMLRLQWRAQLMRYGLHQTVLRVEPVDEGGLHTTAPETLRLLHGYVQSRAEPLRISLQNALLERLHDIGADEDVCNTGCVQRLLDTPAGIDPALMAREPGSAVIRDEINSIAGRINNAFDDEYKLSYTDPAEPEPVPHDPVLEDTVKAGILEQTVIDDLIRRRGWSRQPVQAELNKVMESMKDAR